MIRFNPDVLNFFKTVGRPHVVAENMEKLDFKLMKDMGMEKVILNKYNTIFRGFYSKH